MRRAIRRYVNEERRASLSVRARQDRSSFDLYPRLPEFPLIPVRRLLSRLVYLRCLAQIISGASSLLPSRRLVRAFHCYTRRLRLRLRLALCRLSSYNSSEGSEIQRAWPRPEAASINRRHSCARASKLYARQGRDGAAVFIA